MRVLKSPPEAVVSSAGAAAIGSYRGPLPKVDLGPLGRSMPFRLARRKKWLYAAVAADDLFAAVAIVDLGYASKAFGFACLDGRMVADATTLAPPRAARVGDVTGEGAFARFRGLGAQARIEQRDGKMEVEARFRGLDVAWTMQMSPERPPIAAIAELAAGGINATEKQVLLPAKGSLRAPGVTRAFDDALGGYDYTHGYLARHTAWRWAFLLGRADDGTPVGMNLVEGFVGEAECALWIGDELFAVGEGRFDFDAGAPDKPWRVRTTCGAVDLAFTPWGVHKEDTNLGVVRARFVQPPGAYEGTVRAGGRTLHVTRALGVTEDQDVLW